VAFPARSLAHWDIDAHAWTIEPGSYHLTAGRSDGDQGLIAVRRG
jgi:hypothetical protein